MILLSKIIKADHFHYSSEKKDLSQIRKDRLAVQINQPLQAISHSSDSSMVFEETRHVLEEMIENAKEKAEQIIMEAKMNAEVIQEEISAEAETVRQDAYEEGYQQGIEKAENETKEIKDRAHQILQKAFEDKEQFILDSEREIIDFIVESIESVVLHNLINKDEVILDMSKKLLQFARDAKGKVIIKASPEDFFALEDKLDDLGMIVTTGSLVSKIDKSLSPGHIVVISERGIAEVDVSENIDKIRAVLQNEVLDD